MAKLPRATLPERVDLASKLVGLGFRGIKFAAAIAHDGVVAEMRALREALGPHIEIMVDQHWELSRHMHPYEWYIPGNRPI